MTKAPSLPDPKLTLAEHAEALRGVLRKDRELIDEALSFMDELDLARDYRQAIESDDETVEARCYAYWGTAITLKKHAKAARLPEVTAVAEWLSDQRGLLRGAKESCQLDWLRDPATDEELQELAERLPYPLPRTLWTLYKVTNGLHDEARPKPDTDLLFPTVRTLIDEYERIRELHGIDYYLPVYASNGNYLLVKLDEAEEKRKVPASWQTKGKKPCRQGALLDYNHEEGFDAMLMVGTSIDGIGFRPTLWDP